MKIGPSEGNRAAVIRWGKHLDNGVWLRGWNFRRLWLKWKFRKGYIDLGVMVLQWGN